MSKNLGLRISLLCVALYGSMAPAEAGDWKTQTSKDGKITVHSKVSSMKAANGDEAPLIEYKGTTIATVDFAKCVAVLLDVSKHKTINDDETSRIVETVSDREWIVHYDLSVPWPLPKSDCVAKMTYMRDSTGKVATIAFRAAPTKWTTTKAKRIEVYDLTYTLKDLGAGRVEVSSVGKSSPPFRVPEWMIRSAMPGTVSDPLARILQLAGADSQAAAK
ncbi:MAG: hypothetical protein IPN71_04630 [Fibrobacteres bacterium]|nr:hypothetical protein [Fibrobacterota bacterium]